MSTVTDRYATAIARRWPLLRSHCTWCDCPQDCGGSSERFADDSGVTVTTWHEADCTWLAARRETAHERETP